MQRKEASNGLSILGPDSSFPLVPFRQPFFCFPSSFLVRAQGSGFIRMFTVAETTFFTFTERGLVSIILFERGQGRSTGATLSYYFVFSYFGFPPRVPASMHGSGLCSGAAAAERLSRLKSLRYSAQTKYQKLIYISSSFMRSLNCL